MQGKIIVCSWRDSDCKREIIDEFESQKEYEEMIQFAYEAYEWFVYHDQAREDFCISSGSNPDWFE